MSYFQTLKAMNPAALQLLALKALAVVGITLTLVGGIYLYGRHDGKMACQAAVNRVATKTAEERARNAVAASHRFSEYILGDRELDNWAMQAKADIAEYYAMKAPNPKTKVVYKAGSKEYVNVPIFDCGTGTDVIFDPDELHLYNWGNKRSEVNTPNPVSVPGTLPERTPGTPAAGY